MRGDKRTSVKSNSKSTTRIQKRGVVGYSKKTALLEEAITQMNAGKYGRSSAALKELLALDPQNMEARRLFATLHLRLGSLIPARQAFDSLITEAFQRQDYWLAESLLREYLAAGPRCVPFLEKLGLLYQEKGDALEAVTEYGKAIDILIEDSDAESLQLAAELYKRIRELAPASPVAFRLASLFDAQTGHVLTPHSRHTEAVSVPPLPSSEQNSNSVSLPAPVSGVMPWEVEMPPEALDFSTEPPLTPPPLESSTLPERDDVLVQENASVLVDARPAGLPVEIQTEHNGQQADGLVLEQVLPRELEGASAVPEQVDQVASVNVDNASSCTPLLDLPTAPSDNNGQQVDVPMLEQALQYEPEITPSLHEPVNQAADVSVNNASSVTPPPDATTEIPTLDEFVATASETSAAVQEEEAATDVEEYSPVALSGVRDSANGTSAIDQEAVLLSQETHPPTYEQDRPHETRASSQHSAEVETDVSVVEISSASSVPENTEQIPMNSNAEPWKEPGFSWESLFNKAWNFTERPSEVSPEREELQAKVEESSAVGNSTIQQKESDSIEIPEKGESSSGVEEASTSAVKPMPWDQIEESTIPIPFTQVDEVAARPAESVADHSAQQQAGSAEVPDQALLEPQSAYVSETSSFSITQPPPAPSSPEVDVALARVADAQQSDLESPCVELPSPPLVADATESLEAEEREDLTPPLADAVSQLDSAVPVLQMETQPEGGGVLLENDRQSDDRTVDQVVSDPEHLLIQEPEACSPVDPKREEHLPQQETRETETLIDPLAEPKVLYEPPVEIPPTPPVLNKTVEIPTENKSFSEAVSDQESVVSSESISPRTTWRRVVESIRFAEEPTPAPVVQAPISETILEETIRPLPTDDALAESFPLAEKTEVGAEAVAPRPRSKLRARLNRMRFAVTDFIGSCFSTTRAIVVTCIGLVVLGVLCVVLGVGALGVAWMVMEESPSVAFQSFTTIPQQTLSGTKRNGYLLLLGFDAPAKQEAIQAGAVRSAEARDSKMGLACLGGAGGTSGLQGTQGGQANASAQVAKEWFRGSNPVGQFKIHQDTIKGWVSQHEGLLARYAQWHTLPFEDWGYGQTVSPPCSSILFAHQLYLAVGFTQATDIGIDRLETDMQAWRTVLAQAKTLSVKMLAVQALNDDIAVASGLLVQPDIEPRYVSRLARQLRPLDQAELSLRLPMQSELVVAKQTFDTQLKAEFSEDHTLYAMVASMLPLPKQRRLNDYAEYYDASYKAAGEGQYSTLPKWKNYIQFPAASLMDYLTNPIENVVGLDPLPPWDVYNGFVVDTDAHLRLASLQAWIRSGPQDADLLTRIAKAGQALYDPYTGLPMLVNMTKGALYSVGHDGKDQDADPQTDVVVAIPLGRTPAQEKTSSVSSKSR